MVGGKDWGSDRRSHTITSADLLRRRAIQRSSAAKPGELLSPRGGSGEEGENGVGELSAIPGHKSTCTYRIASESFLYIPCSPRSPRPLDLLLPWYPRRSCGILLTRYRHERLHVRDTLHARCQILRPYFCANFELVFWREMSLSRV